MRMSVHRVAAVAYTSRIATTEAGRSVLGVAPSLRAPMESNKPVSVPAAHQRAADRFKKLFRAVPLHESEKLLDMDVLQQTAPEIREMLTSDERLAVAHMLKVVAIKYRDESATSSRLGFTHFADYFKSQQALATAIANRLENYK